MTPLLILFSCRPDRCRRCASKDLECVTAPGIPGKQAPSSCAECRRTKAKCSFGELEDGTTEATGRVAKRTRRATAADVRSDDDEEEAEEESVKRPAKRVRKAASKTISIP